MLYHIVLTFNKETNKDILNFYNKIKNKLIVEHGLRQNSIPHITIIKFESKQKLSNLELSSIIKDIKTKTTVDFSGITILPSKNDGYWIELSILKNKQLSLIQNKILGRLNKFKILNGVNENFRPHITFAKLRDGDLNFNNLDYSVLRKEKVVGKIAIGEADPIFEFYKIN